MPDKLPSQSGRKALLNIAAGRPASHGLYGSSAHGGFCGTMTALRIRGLVTDQQQLTEAGLQMVQRLTATPEVSHV
jgi:hypothetical protein